MPSPDKAPSNRLKELREGRGLELYDVAAHLRLSVDSVRRWDDNKALIPTKHIPTLAQFLDVPEAVLMGWDSGQLPLGQEVV